jgi:2-polyprenyl-3-methyl-5-hydroxy-6-metoxy-1,4-benzoquinol methylase
MERYVIRGGKEGYERLLLLARERWPDTAALFKRACLSPGMRCIDLGCGGGEVTLEIARLVDPGGSVTGVDMDEIKLGLARREAVRRGLGNVEFRLLDVGDWDEPGSYDVVYCRFLLQHLSQPVGLLRRMWAGVRPGGVLIVEDADFDGAQAVRLLPGRGHSPTASGLDAARVDRGRGKDAGLVDTRSDQGGDRVGAHCLRR